MSRRVHDADLCARIRKLEERMAELERLSEPASAEPIRIPSGTSWEVWPGSDTVTDTYPQYTLT